MLMPAFFPGRLGTRRPEAWYFLIRKSLSSSNSLLQPTRKTSGRLGGVLLMRARPRVGALLIGMLGGLEKGGGVLS